MKNENLIELKELEALPANIETGNGSKENRHIMYFGIGERAIISDESLWKETFGDNFFKHKYSVCVLDNNSLMVIKDSKGYDLLEDIDDSDKDGIWRFYSVVLSPRMFIRLVTLTAPDMVADIVCFYAYPRGKEDIPYIQIDLRKD